MDSEGILNATMSLVRAAIEKGEVKPQDVPKLIDDVGAALLRIQNAAAAQPSSPARLDAPAASPAPTVAMAKVPASLANPGRDPSDPAVPIEESVTPDGEWVVCLEDGKRFKVMGRHLRANYGMTLDDYRAKWGLPASHPLTAPAYAKRKQLEAKKVGLGTNANKAGKGGRRKQPQA